MTRAENILHQVNEFAPILIASGIGAAMGAANIANQIHQAKKRTAEKIQQAGLGAEHQQAKQQLHSLRVKQVKRLGLSGKTAGAIKNQKTHIKSIENRGLQHYHAGLTQNPTNHIQAKQHELTTQHPA